MKSIAIVTFGVFFNPFRRRWKEEARYEKILTDDSLSWFAKGHELDSKLSTFRRWKRSLINRRLARQFAEARARFKLSVSCVHTGMMQACIIKQKPNFRLKASSVCFFILCVLKLFCAVFPVLLLSAKRYPNKSRLFNQKTPLQTTLMCRA